MVTLGFDWENVSTDSTTIKVHQHAANPDSKKAHAMGRSVARLSTKIHVLNGIAIQLKPGDLHDSVNALELLEPIATK